MKKKFISLGGLIAIRREQCRMTQWTLGEALGYTTAQFISNWERNKAPVPPEKFRKISQLLGIPMRELVDQGAPVVTARPDREGTDLVSHPLDNPLTRERLARAALEHANAMKTWPDYLCHIIEYHGWYDVLAKLPKTDEDALRRAWRVGKHGIDKRSLEVFAVVERRVFGRTVMDVL